MDKKYKYWLFTLLAIGVVVAILMYLFSIDIAVLNPKGMIADKQRELFIIVILLMLIIVIPVFALTIFVCCKYKASNSKAKYTPDWDKNHLLETIWWGFPFLLVVALGIIAWKSCHELDPFNPIKNDTKPMRIQVIALEWKWLFIYPEHHIATVNFLQFPTNTPLDFEITSDAPMNSFWIPQLGGQIYAMPGTRSELHLIAKETGSFNGSSANLSGTGFAGMKFIAKASSEEEFSQWVESVKASSHVLNLGEYQELAKPSSYNPVSSYVLEQKNLFDYTVMKYMTPTIEAP
jgi:cytochrome o ubiquinol oxidase subunit 2